MIGHDPVAFLGDRPVEGPQARFEAHGRRRDAELVEEGLRQRVVIVQAGVHDPVLAAAAGEVPRDRRRLDDLRTCADHAEPLHNGVPPSYRAVADKALPGACACRR
ncbi:amino acid adenylation domain-containing protein [Streptomyces azureus]|uniref:Amino acid adenylation domain-containing protein n=1 Tax=Streptomyces azureus TaxID=146537 RepID=A0A0K8PKZ2_STRAJ|nr:amino acid adenylation domain-containing protein [Streptomyces azureus]